MEPGAAVSSSGNQLVSQLPTEIETWSSTHQLDSLSLHLAEIMIDDGRLQLSWVILTEIVTRGCLESRMVLLSEIFDHSCHSKNYRLSKESMVTESSYPSV